MMLLFRALLGLATITVGVFSTVVIYGLFGDMVAASPSISDLIKAFFLGPFYISAVVLVLFWYIAKLLHEETEYREFGRLMNDMEETRYVPIPALLLFMAGSLLSICTVALWLVALEWV